MKISAAGFYEKLKIFWENIPAAGDYPSESALNFLNALADASGASDKLLVEPFKSGIAVIRKEFDKIMSASSSSGYLKERKEAFLELYRELENNYSPVNPEKVADDKIKKKFINAFFPEGGVLLDKPEEKIEDLRGRRIVKITEKNQSPLRNIAEELLFTSNVLLSPPDELTASAVDSDIVSAAFSAGKDPQKYWYDHPVLIGTGVENDEVVYGLKGLAETLMFEKSRGTVPPEAELTVILSVSVTHEKLHNIAVDWLKYQLKNAGREVLAGLNVYAFTENAVKRIVKVISPWLDGNEDDTADTFGVDGEYGRHYSFLKAMPLLWSVLKDRKIKATFKIDLDQVFPEEELCAETGKSAFEHFQTPLWGAEAVDYKNRRIKLGMIAGALVNEKDIINGLFTPDIPWPAGLPEGEDLFFFKQLPMAVSTRAEMMTRYRSGSIPDGEKTALQRIHVTGGTNGILLDSLRHFRPFTPGFIGRAEDQGYILSVLGKTAENGRLLRYVHASGLIMRHDKEAFAVQAIKAGKAGSYVGDLVRFFVFSTYAELLEGGAEAVKEETDPFTGCFITPVPATMALIRLSLKILGPEGGSERERTELLELASRRLAGWLNNYDDTRRNIEKEFLKEQKAWSSFYNAVDILERDINAGKEEALNAVKEFQEIIEECRISL